MLATMSVPTAVPSTSAASGGIEPDCNSATEISRSFTRMISPSISAAPADSPSTSRMSRRRSSTCWTSSPRRCASARTILASATVRTIWSATAAASSMAVPAAGITAGIALTAPRAAPFHAASRTTWRSRARSSSSLRTTRVTSARTAALLANWPTAKSMAVSMPPPIRSISGCTPSSAMLAMASTEALRDEPRSIAPVTPFFRNGANWDAAAYVFGDCAACTAACIPLWKSFVFRPMRPSLPDARRPVPYASVPTTEGTFSLALTSGLRRVTWRLNLSSDSSMPAAAPKSWARCRIGIW